MKRGATILLLLLGCLGTSWGQSSEDCPGFRNPTRFRTDHPLYYWSARIGERTFNSYDHNDTTTGYHIMSTCYNNPEIRNVDSLISNLQVSPRGIPDNCFSGATIDTNHKRFQIITQQNSGLDQHTVRNGTGMQRICPGYTSSIRLGDMNSDGQAIDLSIPVPPNTDNQGSESLYYTLYVTPQNALLIINYAVVARRISHDAYDAGEFLIRVVKQSPDSTWPNAPINDSMWYKVSAPTFFGDQMPTGWLVGWGETNAWPCKYAYKPWTKVAISLNKYLYQTVRIEMYTSDCIYNADPIYAYIAGDYQSMCLFGLGCAKGNSDVVDTIMAPRGLLNYRWYAATLGPDEQIADEDHMESVHFRPLGDTTSSNLYAVHIDDFVITEGPNAGDTVTRQTFMCVMTSALDPNKPFTSKLYLNLDSGRPIVRVGIEPSCDLTAHFTDRSLLPANRVIANDSTRWVIYSDSTGSTVLDTLWGGDVHYTFPAEGPYRIALRVMYDGSSCESTKEFVYHALLPHPLPIMLSDSIACEGEDVTAHCIDLYGLDKEWQVNDSLVCADTAGGPCDAIRWTPSLGETLISLTTLNNGLCPATTTATLHTLGNATITTSADGALLCPGDSTTLHVAGIADPDWLSVPYDSLLGDGNGQNSVTVRPRVTTTYTARPSHHYRCPQSDATVTVTVFPFPEPHIFTHHDYIDRGDPRLIVEDRSAHSTSARWLFSDSTTAEGKHVDHLFATVGDSVWVYLLASNNERCYSDTTVWLPVENTSLWVPNAFTPDGTTNRRFAPVASPEVLSYEIWIYNRLGQLVHHGTDITQGWDGRSTGGSPCPQGAYAYFFRYTLAVDTKRPHTVSGTVTLLR